MAFRFRFQSVLNYRRHQAEMAEMELARAQQLLAEAEESLATLKANRETALQNLAHCLHQGLDGTRLHLWRIYLTDLETRIDQQIQKVEALSRAVTGFREKLLEATRKKKVLEKLRSHEQEAWRYTEDRREEKELGETAVQGMARRSR
jgi:flagellar protein FliJ